MFVCVSVCSCSRLTCHPERPSQLSLALSAGQLLIMHVLLAATRAGHCHTMAVGCPWQLPALPAGAAGECSMRLTWKAETCDGKQLVALLQVAYIQHSMASVFPPKQNIDHKLAPVRGPAHPPPGPSKRTHPVGGESSAVITSK